MKRKITQTRINILVVAVFLLLLNSTLGIFLTMQSSNAMIDLIQSRMLDVTNTAASMIDGDVLATIQKEDRNTPEYQEIINTLAHYQDNIDLKYIYCIRDMGDGTFTFTADPTVVDPAGFGEPVVYTDALYEASLGHAAVDKEPYTDSWGTFYSSYSPVFDSQGNVGGIVAVDFSADWYDRQISKQIRTTALITFLSLSFGTIIVLLIASRSRRRYHSLMNELSRLSDGIETLATELSDGEPLEGIELLHNDNDIMHSTYDDVSALGEKIRSLEEYMSVQIKYVRSKAYIDGLTDLENRTAYLEYTAELNTMIKNKCADFSVAMFDINGLKNINDELGHDRGDKEILQAADILQKTFRGERIFRIGGDEFVVVIGCTGKRAEALMAAFSQMSADTSDKKSAEKIMSTGFAEFDPAKDMSYQNTFERADKLMYENKKNYYETCCDRRHRDN